MEMSWRATELRIDKSGKNTYRKFGGSKKSECSLIEIPIITCIESLGGKVSGRSPEEIPRETPEGTVEKHSRVIPSREKRKKKKSATTSKKYPEKNSSRYHRINPGTNATKKCFGYSRDGSWKPYREKKKRGKNRKTFCRIHVKMQKKSVGNQAS